MTALRSFLPQAEYQERDLRLGSGMQLMLHQKGDSRGVGHELRAVLRAGLGKRRDRVGNIHPLKWRKIGTNV